MEAKLCKIFASVFVRRRLTSATFSTRNARFRSSEISVSGKSTGLAFSDGLSLPNHLEVDVQICEEQIEFGCWIGCDILSISAGAEVVVIPPAVGVG